MANRLIRETSPYLRQHAHNPVDWYPWGPEALAKAEAEQKPVFLSIGYAACHWCHVMERESFEDEATARILNERFVAVKVDREERPDLDGIYMGAVVALTGSGGWPMTVFLAPGGKPFYGGTYFPKERRYGMPSFTEVLRAVADAWETRREEVLEGGERIAAAIREASKAPPEEGPLDPGVPAAAVGTLRGTFDRAHGGWGEGPKFPPAMTVEFLLREHARTGDPSALPMATRTLDAMAQGGLRDPLGGGFHRYCVDGGWNVPHFEKMLYDNALLARAYLHGWQATGKEEYRLVARETLDFVLREMTDPLGGFYSSLDADSEGEEGKYYVWDLEEVRSALGPDGVIFADAHGMSLGGNFEGKNVLHARTDPEELARRHRISARELAERLTAAREALRAVRERRVRPFRDEKVLAGWNGLMLAAFAEAARALGRREYGEAAERNARFLLGEMRGADGRLLRSWMGGAAAGNGFLEDQAHVAEGLLALYETTFDPRWFTEARNLAEAILARFPDPAGGFFDTSDDHEALLVRPKDLADNAVPSGGAMAARLLLALAACTGEGRYSGAAERALRAVQRLARQAPHGHSHWLCALSFALGPRFGVAIVGEGEGARRLLAAAREGFRPHQVVAAGPGSPDTPVPLLRGKTTASGRPAAYVCRDLACGMPVTSPEELSRRLSGRD